METVKIAFYISTFIINGAINYTLIFGHFGAPRLGVQRAAIGTLTARIIELMATILYIGLRDQKLHLRLKDFFYIEPVMLADFLKICFPVVVTYGLWGIATGMQTVILGHMDSNAIAANSVVTTFLLVLKTISVGASSASAVIIAKTVGGGQINKIKEYSRTLQVLYLIIGIATSLMLFLMRASLLNFYKLTPDARSLANAFLLVLCFTCVGTAYQMPVLGGVIRGGGDTKFVLISIWFIVLPISFWAAFWLHLPTVLIVFLLNSDQIFKCGVAAIKVNRYKWIRTLTRKEESAPA